MRDDRKRHIDSRIEVDGSGCWLYAGCINSDGYGIVGGRGEYVHRLQYERYVGPIPDGLQLDHLCRVRHCVNPAHLEPVTSRENSMRSSITIAARNAAKTHCPRNHEYTPENTYVDRKRGGGRQCRACTLDRAARAWRSRKAAEAARAEAVA